MKQIEHIKRLLICLKLSGLNFQLRKTGRRAVMGILVNFELDLVEIKVQELHRLVDIFVIVESNVTLGTVFIGNPTECVTDRYRPDLWLRIYIIESR